MTALAIKQESNWYSVPSYQVENPVVWRPIEAILTAKCEEYRPNDIRHAVVNGEMQMWVAAPEGPIAAVILTQIGQRRSGKVLTVLFCGGSDMRLWIDERWRIKDWARQMGCRAVRFEGREGWGKIFPEARQTGVKWEVEV